MKNILILAVIIILGGISLSMVRTTDVPAGNKQSAAALLSIRGILTPNLFKFSGTYAGLGTTTPASMFHVANTPLDTGVVATTTFEVGAATSSSRSCYNARNTAGDATSFYFVGTTLTVEAKRCL